MQEIDLLDPNENIDFNTREELTQKIHKDILEGLNNKEIKKRNPRIKASSIPKLKKKFISCDKSEYESMLKPSFASSCEGCENGDNYFDKNKLKTTLNASYVQRLIAQEQPIVTDPKKQEMITICRVLDLIPPASRFNNRELVRPASEYGFDDFKDEEILIFPRRSDKNKIKECHLSDLKESKPFICSVRFWVDIPGGKKVYSISLLPKDKRPRDFKTIPFYISKDGNSSNIADVLEEYFFEFLKIPSENKPIVLLEFIALKEVFKGWDELLIRFLRDITADYEVWFAKAAGNADSAEVKVPPKTTDASRKNIRLTLGEHKKLSFFCDTMNIKLSQAVETMICNIFLLQSVKADIPAGKPTYSLKVDNVTQNFLKFVKDNSVNTDDIETKTVSAPKSAGTLRLVKEKLSDFSNENNDYPFVPGSKITENNLFRFVINSSLDSICGFNDFYKKIVEQAKKAEKKPVEFWEEFFRENYGIEWKTYIKCNAHIPFDIFAERLNNNG
ncbi:MAG: hypothetical protein K6E56_06145 [Lachnospiraceae bacterium]|nr:hypothetical protein [Lachnospiraceae bacterium]